jgi:hypothetical protein
MIIEYDLHEWDSELAYGRVVESNVDILGHPEQQNLPADESEDVSSDVDMTSSSREDDEPVE